MADSGVKLGISPTYRQNLGNLKTCDIHFISYCIILATTLVNNAPQISAWLKALRLLIKHRADLLEAKAETDREITNTVLPKHFEENEWGRRGTKLG